MQKETLQLTIILTSHAKQIYHLKPHRGHTGKSIDPRCGCGGNPSRCGDLYGTLDGVAVG